MGFEFEVVMDFAGSLAVVAILASGYGTLERYLQRPEVARVVLGVLFGLVAWAQMHAPFEAMPGLIIDLRNVPIALAGAFLGWRGMLACLAIGVAARLNIGGAGALSGALGMTIAGHAGLLWARLSDAAPRRGLFEWVGLSVIMSTHLAGAMILPQNMAAWFYSEAALPLLVVNLLSVTFVAMLLDRERNAIAGETRLLSAVQVDPDSGLLTGPAWLRDVKHAYAADDKNPVRGIMLVHMRKLDWLVAQHGGQRTRELSGAIRHRVKSLLTHGDIVGDIGGGRLIVPMSAVELANADSMMTEVRRAVAAQSFGLPGGCDTCVSVTAEVRQIAGMAQLPQMLLALQAEKQPAPSMSCAPSSCSEGRPALAPSKPMDPALATVFMPLSDEPNALHAALFGKAEALSNPEAAR